jgi:cell division septum initiation protein DivIVA
VGGITDWPPDEFDKFLDMCQNAIVAAREQYAQNSKALKALREALSNKGGIE